MNQTYNPTNPATSQLATSARRLQYLLLVVWLVLTVAAIAYVLVLGTNCPNADEWEFVPALTGHEPLRQWLWTQHNEHRLPLPRLIYYVLFQLTHDFRTGSFLQVAMLSALSLGLIRLAARLRGRPHWADLFFPVSLLHVGHWENFLIGYNIAFALCLVLTTAIGRVAMFTTRDTAARSGIGAGLLMVLLVLCGGGGLVAAVPVAGWLVYLAIATRKAAAKWKTWLLLTMAMFPFIYLGVYLDSYHRPAHHPPLANGGIAIASVTGQVLSMAFGGGVADMWLPVLLGMLVLGTATLGVLISETKSSVTRPAAVGLFAVIAGIVGVALVIGIGRAGMGSDMGLWSRYTYLTWPLLALAYLVWVPRGGWGGKWVPILLCTVAVIAFPANNFLGLLRGMEIRGVLSRVEVEAMAGMSPEWIVRDWAKTFQDGQQQRAIVGIPMLRDAGIGAFTGKSSSEGLWRVAGVIGAIILFGLGVRWLFHLWRAVQVERARELFRLQHERFEQMLLKAAAATGKPRGLTWTQCVITGDAILAREMSTRRIVAFVPVVVHFEPVAGSDMEGVPAAREPRPATALFHFHRGHWHTDGRIVFNLDSHQTIAHFCNQFAIIESHH